MTQAIDKRKEGRPSNRSTCMERPSCTPTTSIAESDNEITLTATMPGVDHKSAQARVEDHILTVEGDSLVDHPEGYELIRQEFRAGRFRRRFSLPRQADTQKMKAHMSNGVLKIQIPKQTGDQSRQIKIAG